MNYMSSWKMPKDSLAVATTIRCFFYPSSHIKIAHITISSFPEFSATVASSSSTTFRSSASGCNQVGSLLKNRKRFAFSCSKDLVSSIVKRPCSGDGKRPLWRKWKLVFGSKKFRSIILLNVITFVYASNITVIKEVEALTDPAYFSAIRFSISTIPFLPLIFRARNDVQTRNSGLELGLWVSLGYLSEALGLLTSDASRASFISLFTIGDLFNFLSAIFFGIHTLRTEHISRTTGKENLLALLGYEVSVVAVFSIIWCLIGANSNSIQDSEGMSWSWARFLEWFFAFPWIPALYTGVFSTGLCLWGEISAMRDVSAIETAVIYGLEPLWGAGFAWFLLGERWGIAGWIGAALILGGSLTVQMFGASANEANEVSEKEKDNEITSIVVSDGNKLEKTMSTSPVMVRSRDNKVMDMLNK